MVLETRILHATIEYDLTISECLSFQSGLAETLNQGSAYLATAVSSASAAAAAATAPSAAAATSSASVGLPCRHSDSEEEMKEYLPQETEETEQILEEEAAGGGDLPRRRKSGSLRNEVSFIFSLKSTR